MQPVTDLVEDAGVFIIRDEAVADGGVLVAVDSPNDGDLFGVRLPRNAGPGPLGRGQLVRPGTIAPLQIALPD